MQTQVCYLAGFHDEPKAKWVAAFGEPSVTLDVERVSDKSVQPRYHGLDAFCEESGTPDAVDYFGAMIRAATVRYSVRYEVGTVDDGRGSAADAAPEGLAGATSGAADLLGSACQFSDASLAPKYTASKAAGGSSAPSWMAGGVGAAAASRRRNPFLRRERTAPAWRAACDASGVTSYADFGVTLSAVEPVAPEEEADPVAAFDAAHAAGDFEELLVSLRDASRAASELDAAVEWRYARACLDVADARGDATREGLVREGLEAARRSAALAPADGLAQKWLGIMLGSVGDYETTKEKLGNSYAIKDALDVAWAARPDDATVALALGQWCLKVAGVSFVERGLARAIFGGSPPTATFAEALAYFQRADKLRPAPKTKALIKLVQKKMK